MQILKGLILSLILAAGSAFAQSFVYDDVDTHDNSLYPNYVYTQQGSPDQGPYSFHFYSFHFTVSGGTGSASFLNGNDYIGFCVNTMFPDPSNGNPATYNNNGTLLSYNLGTGDYWGSNGVLKFNAMKDVLAYYGNQLRTTDPNSQSYADLVTGINLAFTEIICDFDGTIASMDLNNGNSTATLKFDGTPIASGTALDAFNQSSTGVAYDVYSYIRSNVVGSGVGSSYSVFTATAPTDAYQDVIFIAKVPEPTTTLLVFGGLCLVAFRRRPTALTRR